ncbi:GTP cyclohydrolase FolE2 [Stenotrophomonas sp. 24(2023)]|uniref:GTP cyclohydrolase FolE2 n=1 Tax=Stenotrophomonas sp. 24(2023) TaxID=3068324 RepID=UPI0027E16DE6|nr:GTP cyclohydrolase FolE2 [Stenotrophomonas sp. 24(2023)]WMJ69300.1 GTP cyclohydrolase FolE2 [Stenotrophomonas sp. 24(2023)]
MQRPSPHDLPATTAPAQPVLPDVCATEPAALPAALDWVGMEGIQMPLQLDDPLAAGPAPTTFDLWVDLPQAGTKGIHMSRLYGRLQAMTAARVAPSDIAALLASVIDSHADCGSTAARLSCSTRVLRPVQALVTPGLHGWAEHPVRLHAEHRGGQCSLWLCVEVVYASTCPCSAALSRQLIQAQFRRDHAAGQAVPVEEVAAWIGEHGSHATPHSQRSVATLQVALDPGDARAAWGIGDLVMRAEAALGTPVQGPVKRADEQAFARRNGQNLMFVEDAARRLLAALRPWHAAGTIAVRHLESLHPHDAVARASWHGGAG